MKPRLLALFLGLLLMPLPAQAQVRFEATFDPAVREEAATGRLVVLLVREGSRVWESKPADGPFWEDPQPLFGRDVSGLQPGQAIQIGPEARFPNAFPHPPGELEPGKYKAQAILDMHKIESLWSREPGNLFSDPVEFEVKAGEPVTVALRLSNIVEARPFPQRQNLREISMESRLLSEFRGERVMMNAGVLLPIDYDPEKQYAAVYVIPGFGGRHDDIRQYARRTTGDWGKLRRRAFIIMLDPESPNGHTLFCDSRVNGPWAEALIRELILVLEAQFPLKREPWARIVTGHSSGGWSSLWLAVQYPETFGACWSTGPDPVDFRRFQLIDIYAEQNAYLGAAGAERPAARFPVGPEREYQATMTVREEVGGESVLGPEYTSGQQWASWMACWGSPNPERPGFPQGLFDAATGEIDPREARRYEEYDIRLLLARHPERYVPIFAGNVRLICGEMDNYYLNKAVALLKEELEKHERPEGPGYIKLVPGDHEAALFMRPEMLAIPREMVEHLERHE